MRRYAQETTVSVAKTRGEIDALLRRWGCDGIRWTDHYARGAIALEFIWHREDAEYLARFSIQLPSDKELRGEAKHQTTGRFLQTKFEKLQASRGRQEHRLLLLWLKAALNAVDAGIVEPETIFLPFLVGRDGQTVAEAALPRLQTLLVDGSRALLGIPANVD